MKSLLILAAFVGMVFSIPLVGEAGGRVVVQRQAVVVRNVRAPAVVVAPQRVVVQRQVVQPHFQSFRQPVIVQQQLGFGLGGYGGVQAIVQPQCVGGSCGQLLLVR
jgi:hypothetical protein